MKWYIDVLSDFDIKRIVSETLLTESDIIKLDLNSKSKNLNKNRIDVSTLIRIIQLMQCNLTPRDNFPIDLFNNKTLKSIAIFLYYGHNQTFWMKKKNNLSSKLKIISLCSIENLKVLYQLNSMYYVDTFEMYQLLAIKFSFVPIKYLHNYRSNYVGKSIYSKNLFKDVLTLLKKDMNMEFFNDYSVTKKIFHWDLSKLNYLPSVVSSTFLLQLPSKLSYCIDYFWLLWDNKIDNLLLHRNNLFYILNWKNEINRIFNKVNIEYKIDKNIISFVYHNKLHIFDVLYYLKNLNITDLQLMLYLLEYFINHYSNLFEFQYISLFHTTYESFVKYHKYYQFFNFQFTEISSKIEFESGFSELMSLICDIYDKYANQLNEYFQYYDLNKLFNNVCLNIALEYCKYLRYYLEKGNFINNKLMMIFSNIRYIRKLYKKNIFTFYYELYYYLDYRDQILFNHFTNCINEDEQHNFIIMVKYLLTKIKIEPNLCKSIETVIPIRIVVKLFLLFSSDDILKWIDDYNKALQNDNDVIFTLHQYTILFSYFFYEYDINIVKNKNFHRSIRFVSFQYIRQKHDTSFSFIIFFSIMKIPEKIMSDYDIPILSDLWIRKIRSIYLCNKKETCLRSVDVVDRYDKEEIYNFIAVILQVMNKQQIYIKDFNVYIYRMVIANNLLKSIRYNFPLPFHYESLSLYFLRKICLTEIYKNTFRIKDGEIKIVFDKWFRIITKMQEFSFDYLMKELNAIILSFLDFGDFLNIYFVAKNLISRRRLKNKALVNYKCNKKMRNY